MLATQRADRPHVSLPCHFLFDTPSLCSPQAPPWLSTHLCLVSLIQRAEDKPRIRFVSPPVVHNVCLPFKTFVIVCLLHQFFSVAQEKQLLEVSLYVS